MFKSVFLSVCYHLCFLALTVSSISSVHANDFSSLPLKTDNQLSFETSEGTWMSVDISPDGQTIMFDILGDIYRMPASGGQATPFMVGMPYVTQAVFAPNGKKIAYISDTSGNNNLYVANIDGSHPVQITDTTLGNVYNPVFTHDCKGIIVTHNRRAKLYSFDGENIGAVLPLTDRSYRAITASADSKFYYYIVPSRKGYSIKQFDIQASIATTIVISKSSLHKPIISPDGKTLVYIEDLKGKAAVRALSLGEKK